MTCCKYTHFLMFESGLEYDTIYKAGTSAPFPGIYYCEACGSSVTAMGSQPLPSNDQHLHAPAQGPPRYNYALRDVPEEKIRYHVCWGSWNGPHTSDVPLRDIVDLILRVRAQAYVLEAANPRHEHEWQVWESVKLPDGKILIPGLVAHSTNVVEHPELIAWRIKNFARLVGRENVIAGTDCGFSQNWNTVRVHPSIQWAKLEALAQGARLASKELWK
jgi:5-methyltetrahydropteroyltriglutamate--homocysteine methyltransferase